MNFISQAITVNFTYDKRSEADTELTGNKESLSESSMTQNTGTGLRFTVSSEVNT